MIRGRRQDKIGGRHQCDRAGRWSFDLGWGASCVMRVFTKPLKSPRSGTSRWCQAYVHYRAHGASFKRYLRNKRRCGGFIGDFDIRILEVLAVLEAFFSELGDNRPELASGWCSLATTGFAHHTHTPTRDSGQPMQVPPSMMASKSWIKCIWANLFLSFAVCLAVYLAVVAHYT